MDYVQTRDILEKARKFHLELRAFFKQEMEAVDSDWVKLILSYISNHEQKLADELERVENDAKASVMDAWFKYAPESLDDLKTFDYHIPQDADANDVLAIALNFDSKLVQFYQDAARETSQPKVKELFENLLEQEKSEERRLARNALMDF